MITLPEAAPPPADLRSGGRFLLGVLRQQRGHLLLTCLVATGWMLAEAAAPPVLGHTIDAGVLGRDRQALLLGCLALLGVILAGAALGTMTHRLNVFSWLLATLRSQQQIGHHLADQGMAVTRDTTSGEVAEVIGPDTHKIGEFASTVARAVAAVLVLPVMVAVVLRIDVVAGIWVAVGLPLMTALLAVLIRPLQARESAQRSAMSRLAALGSDTAAGLRVLRGIGGERQFVARYAEGSQDVRRQGVNVARAWGLVEAAQVGLPGIFVIGLIWLGARGVLSGRVSGGELVTLYGSAALMRLPVDIVSELLYDLVSARIASRRVVAVLGKRDDAARPGDPGTQAIPGPEAELADPVSGVRVGHGQLTALVSAVPEQAAAIAEQLAGLAPGQVRLGGVPLSRIPAEQVRDRIQLGEAEPRLFSGTLRQQLDPAGTHGDDAIVAAVAAADAMDVLDGVPDGLDAPVEERGRGFSGGQRQRLALARALLSDPGVLMLVEPTSAVDAHTESRVAARLRPARAGRTTVVTTASPLVLRHCDRVLFLDDGQVAAEGTHSELLRTNAGYRRVVTRDLSEEE